MSWKQLCASQSATRPQPRAGRPGDTVAAGEGRTGAPLRGGTAGMPRVSDVSGDGPVHRFSTCSSQGLLLVTAADPSWPHQTKGRASPAAVCLGRWDPVSTGGWSSWSSPARSGTQPNGPKSLPAPSRSRGQAATASSPRGYHPNCGYRNKQTEEGSRMGSRVTEIAGTRYRWGRSPRKDKTQRIRWGMSHAGEQGMGKSRGELSPACTGDQHLCPATAPSTQHLVVPPKPHIAFWVPPRRTGTPRGAEHPPARSPRDGLVIGHNLMEKSSGFSFPTSTFSS